MTKQSLGLRNGRQKGICNGMNACLDDRMICGPWRWQLDPRLLVISEGEVLG